MDTNINEIKEIEIHSNGLTFPALEVGEGPLVLCLHGFPDNNRSYHYQLSALAEAGYRVIAPTMRGYHPKCIPQDGDYRHARMAEDVLGWLDDLGCESAHIIGHDHGSFGAAAACIVAPERFKSLVLIAVPHSKGLHEAAFKYPSQVLKSWYHLFFHLRPIARYVVERNDWAFIENLWREWSPGWKLPIEQLQSVKHTLALPGVKRAALAYYYTGDIKLDKTGKRDSDPIQVPTLGITGALDGCIDTRIFDLTMTKESFPKGVEFIRYDDAGHFVHQEKPEEVNQLLIDWLARNS